MCIYSVRIVQFNSFACSCPVFWALFIEVVIFPLYILAFFCGLINHIGVGLFLGSLFCFIDLWVCFSARTLLFWLLYLCSIVQNQGQWLLKFCSSFSILPWLFRVLCASIQILKSFALVFWEMPLLLWKELQWFCKLPWALIRKEELYPRKWGRESTWKKNTVRWVEEEWKGRIRG